jgi:hypothetical protein
LEKKKKKRKKKKETQHPLAKYTQAAKNEAAEFLKDSINMVDQQHKMPSGHRWSCAICAYRSYGELRDLISHTRRMHTKSGLEHPQRGFLTVSRALCNDMSCNKFFFNNAGPRMQMRNPQQNNMQTKRF